MHERPLFFLHIPKTAGLSLHWAMVNTFPLARLARVNSERELWTMPLSQVRDLCYLAGHVHYGFTKVFAREPFIFTFLRSPIERTISAYWHIRSENPDRFPDPAFRDIILECKRRSLEEILLDGSSPSLTQLSNSQTWYLSGKEISSRSTNIAEIREGNLADWYLDQSRNEPTELSQDDLERAKHTLDNIPLFGLLEQMERSLDLFNRRLGFEPASMPRINRRKSGRTGTSLTSPALRRLNQLTAFDQRLYEYAHKRFEERQEEMSERMDDSCPFAPEVAPLASEVHRNVGDGFVGGGWYPRDARNNSAWCWTGLLPRAWIDFCIDIRQDLEIHIELSNCLDWDVPGSLCLEFMGNKLKTRFQKKLRGGELKARLPAVLTGLGPRRIRIEIPEHRTVVPAEIVSHSTDRRSLGWAMKRFSVTQNRGPD